MKTLLWEMKTRKLAGFGTVEMILLIVVLIAVVLIFKSQITSLVQSIFQNITNQALSV
ncbi:MAG: hypothetical protein LUI10_03615 [Lachnospiraceae bacterium]|nr:hypothetical protein [Lachnospiraceae bacterium]